MSEQVEEDIKVKTKRRAKQAYKEEKKMNKRRDKSKYYLPKIRKTQFVVQNAVKS